MTALQPDSIESEINNDFTIASSRNIRGQSDVTYSMTLSQALTALRARWLTALIVFSAIMALTITATVLLPKKYIAYATVVADVKTNPVAGAVDPDQMQANYVATQADIISSERVARKVVEEFKLDQSPELREKWRKETDGRGDFISWLAYYLQRHLVVTPERESDVIDIGVEWTNAKAAAALANAFARAYIDISIALKVEPAKRYADWFKEQASALRADLEAKQKILSDFQQKNGIVVTDDRLDVENARLADLTTQLVAVQGQRQDSQSRQQQRDDPDVLPDVLQSPLIATLKGQLETAEISRDSLQRQLGDKHPDFLKAQAAVVSLRERIEQETQRVVSSLDTTTKENLQRESSLKTAIESQKNRILQLKQQHDTAAVLQNDVLTAQRDLDSVNQRLAQSSLESLSQQSSVAMLTTATEPFRHSSPKLLLNLIVGMFVGGVLGIGIALLLEARNPRVRHPEELARLLGLPVLARIMLVRPEDGEIAAALAVDQSRATAVGVDFLTT